MLAGGQNFRGRCPRPAEEDWAVNALSYSYCETAATVKYMSTLIDFYKSVRSGVSNSFNAVGQCDGVVVRASTLQSVDLRFISQVESYQKTLINGIHSFSAWRSAK